MRLSICKIAHSKYGITFWISLITVAILSFSIVASVKAAEPGFAYGLKNVSGIRGNKQWHWLDYAPQGYNNFSRSVVGICNDSSCLNSQRIKTGYAYGNHIGNSSGYAKQYVQIKDNAVIYFGDWLPDQRWYKFQVLYSNSAARWEVWRDDVPRWFYTGNAGFTSGSYAQVGGESASPVYFNVYGLDLQYKVGTNGWVFYNYNSTLKANACISPAYTYGFRAWVAVGC